MMSENKVELTISHCDLLFIYCNDK